jgi:iron-sulfur cluster insertion protein
MITLTSRAIERITDLLAEFNKPEARIRLYVKGGGCAGMTYNFMMDEDFSEDDFKLNIETAKVCIDATTAQYVEGATVDYVEELWESKFVVDNPNAQTSCGCGTSFVPKTY